MLDRTAGFSNEASNLTDKNVSEKADTGTFDFALACEEILGPRVDKGLILHYLTDCDERRAYRYAKGENKPRIDFMLNLFNSHCGEAFFRCFTAHIHADWWEEWKRRAER
jgi:hypothetical protein